MSQSKIKGTCPYCKSSILGVEEYSICPGCNVPHHKECWLNNDGCTTYACKGIAPIHQTIVEEDYSFQDLAEEYLPKKLIINMEDLHDVELVPRSYPGIPAVRPTAAISNNYSAFTGALWPLIWAGLIGGFATWMLTGYIFAFEYYANHQLFNMVLSEMMAFSAIMGGIVGACLGAVEGVTSKVQSKTINGILTGVFVGVIGAGIGAILGQFVYHGLGGDQIDHLPILIFARGLFWAFVGLFIGYGQGIGSGGGEKAKNGLIGGMIGGALGGSLFDLFFLIFHSATFSALIAIVTFGICIGLGIGMVQEFRKEAWLKVLKGATSGKEYIIHKNKTTLGSHPRSDIVLVMDSEVAANHAVISIDKNYHLHSTSEATGVFINGKKIKSDRLKNGDRIKIGGYEMIFFEKNIT